MPTSKHDILIQLKASLEGLTQATQALAALEDGATDAAGGMEQATGAADPLAAGVERAGQAANRSAGFFTRLGDSLKQGLSFAVGNQILGWLTRMPSALANAAQQGIAFNATLEDTTRKFTAMLGSAGMARTRVEELTRFAATTPFDLPGVLETNVLLQNLTNGALATEEGMRMVGDAAVVTGRPMQEVAMLIGRLYTGLQNGTPISEFTLRLLEMGVVTGDVKRELDSLQAQGLTGPEAWDRASAGLRRHEGAMKALGGSWNQLMSNLGDSWNQATARAMEPVYERARALLDRFLSEDTMGPVASKVAAYLDLGFKAFRDGTLFELITLTIEAAVEQGTGALARAFSALQDALASGAFWTKVLDAVMRFAVAVTRVLLRAFTLPVDILQASLVKVASEVDVLIERITSLGGTTRQAATYAEALAAVQGENAENLNVALAWLEAQLAVSREAIGTLNAEAEAVDATAGAWARLAAMLRGAEEARAAERERAKAAGGGPAPAAAPTEAYNLERATAAQRDQLEALRRERARMEARFDVTEVERYFERLRLMERERELLSEIISLLEAKAASADAGTAATIRQDIEAFRRERENVTGSIEGVGPNPFSTSENLTAGIVAMFNELGTLAQDTADLIEAPMQGALAGISGSLQGLIMGTMTWRQALLNVGQAIAGAVVQAFADMVANWIVRRMLMFVFGRKLDAMEVAANAAKNTALVAQEAAAGTATAAAWTPAALMKSIATMGVAVLIGAALFAAVAGGFRSGGYTGDGDPAAPAGIVHRGEFVFPADVVAARGPAYFAQLMNDLRTGGPAQPIGGPVGRLSTPAGGMAGGSGEAGPARLSVAVFDDRSSLRDYLRTADGEVEVVNILQRNRHLFGIG